MHVHGHSARHTHGTLAGFRFLAVLGGFIDLVGRNAAGFILPSQLGGGIQHAVGLLVAALAVLFAAGGAGGCVVGDIAGRFGGHCNVFRVHGLVQPRVGRISRHRYAHRRADARAFARRGSVRSDGVLGVRRSRNADIAVGLQDAAFDHAQIRFRIRADNIHGRHGHRSGATGRASLSGDGVGHFLGSGDGDALDILTRGFRGNLRVILNRGVGIRTVHGYGNASAYACFRGLLAAGRVAVYGKGHAGIGAYAQLTIQLQISTFMHQRFAVDRRYLHCHRAADARVALAVARFGVCLNIAFGGGFYVHIAGAGHMAAHVRAAFTVHHGHGDAGAQAGIHGGAVGLAGLEFTHEGNLHFRRVFDGVRHDKGVRGVALTRHVHFFRVGAVLSFEQSLERALLDLEVVGGFDRDSYGIAPVSVGNIRRHRTVFQLRAFHLDLFQRQGGGHGQLGFFIRVLGYGKRTVAAAGHGLAVIVLYFHFGDLIARFDLFLIGLHGHLIAGSDVLFGNDDVLVAIVFTDIDADGLELKGSVDLDRAALFHPGHGEGIHALDFLVLVVLGFGDFAVLIAELKGDFLILSVLIDLGIGHRQVVDGIVGVGLDGDFGRVVLLDLFIVQGNRAVLDLFLGLEVMEFFLECAGHADLDALGQLGRVQIPQTVVLLFQLHIAHAERTQIKPAGFQRAVQLIALILFRRGAKDVVRFAVVRLGFLVFYCAGLLLVVFEGIVFDFNDMRQQRLGLSPIMIHAKLAFLGESEADRGDAALVDVEFLLLIILFIGSYDQVLVVNDVFIAILDHLHPVLAVLALFELDGFLRQPVIVGEQSAGDGITFHRCGGENIGVFVFCLAFPCLDLFGSHRAVDRFVHIQAKEEVAVLVIAGIILCFGTLDRLIVLGFLFFCRRRVFLGHRRAVGSGIYVGFHGGNNVHFPARVYLRARVDHSLAVVGRHGHGDGAGHLGLGFVGILAGIAVLKFRRYLETAVGQQVFGNVENIAAFAVSLDHNGLGDFFFFFLLFTVFVFGFDLFGHLIGHFEASLLELLALRGIDQQAKGISQLNLFQVFVRLVGHVVIGQHRAAVAARQVQLHFFTLVLGILQHFVQLLAVFVLGAALHVVQQLLQIGIVVLLLRLLFKQVGSLPGAFVFLVRLFLVIHEDDHILINALEGFGPFLVQVDFPGEALEGILTRHIGAYRDALDIVAFPGFHVHDQLGLAVFGHDVGFDLALLLGVVVELDRFIGGSNLLHCFVQLFLGGIIGDEVLDLGPHSILDGAEHTIHHIAHHSGQGIVRSLDGGR